MFMGEVIQKQRLFVTFNERTVKIISFNTVYDLTARKTVFSDRFRIQSEGPKL